ncbi:protein-disulfide isomerase [Sanguibacter keddieii DSM 10542]|uniref:Protein-disulfide isomerase n=1 Tax=Sanguibacter keddieii (strain ATCC 51767 / DSM 10542 / NCFB 3025 / ST-74) TaxID=446469 RepID=D1BDR7_SANKS|nr:thioredoxin domain-containing protein [Sanguibacter keddieii]ACZ21129.1 protein-disulfide isomerase [Sanguibacter keddieii DSM 10542]
MPARSSRLVASVVAALAAVVLGALVYVAISSGSSSAERPASGPAAPALAADTRLLSDAGEGAVTVVEFLDFECEVCAAVYPVLEDLRAEHEGQVTFAIRYFPMPGHANSTTAAVAVEAAARQGRLEEMYHRMFDTQAQWGEQQVSQADLFRTFAEDLGLDLEVYDRDVADPEVLDRVASDFEAGVALGVQGTPTIFVDDVRVELRTEADLRAAIDAALQARQG